MTDIVIYTKIETIKKKKRKGYFHWWSLFNPPIKFKKGERIWFAAKGYVVGSVECFKFSPDDRIQTVEWDGESWKPCKDKIAVKSSFRGFKYRWW